MVNIAKPEVSLIAFSECDLREIEDFQDIDDHSTGVEDIIEFAGRACYQSFHKPNPATRANKDYLNRTLLEQGHWSIAEHASATVYITGVSRAFTHELIRHRHLSFSQLSQRFVDESEANIVVPPALRGNEEAIELLKSDAEVAFIVYSKLVERLIAEGKTRKQAREAARCVLPNMAETRIVVTGNFRAWHEVIERRTAPDVDAEMVEVMGLIREALCDESTVIFGGRHHV